MQDSIADLRRRMAVNTKESEEKMAAIKEVSHHLTRCERSL